MYNVKLDIGIWLTQNFIIPLHPMMSHKWLQAQHRVFFDANYSRTTN